MPLRLARAPSRVAPSGQPPRLVEVISPRTNGATYTPAEHLFAALARRGGVALELAGDGGGRRFYARSATTPAGQLLASQPGAAYPQARLRPVSSTDDPARRRAGEEVAACTL